ncbi:2'-5' RNA ligase family protein [Hymenobacter jejuensis]|uniref:2'-5' RNA ligase family protein n=1 Tax=Hymenobacter jejuensis TaxID=2502781 RepID=A0A5B8A427_9BACT|nr:2'-5' RNA ligase family protein [Hymenobacter jejuensis]QDA62164.1 2'-5' RNA ligase family protein [Hymenobacter jejuensis]
MNVLYLVAVMPPEPVLSEVWGLKQEVHRLTGSRNALKLPAHITLIPPLRQPPEFEIKFRAALSAFAATQAPFAVGLRNFAWFGDRTLFVQINQPTGIQAFQAQLEAWCATHLPEVPREKRPFTPHMTLATRDLSSAQVPELRTLFAARHFEAEFSVRAFQLFRHDGRSWHVIEEFGLNDPTN